MKMAVVYSSKTGNTKKVAEAILDVMPQGTDIFPVTEAPSPDDYDFMALGFWVDKGQPDKAMEKYMATVRGPSLGLFGTLGAWPDSEHARDSMEKAKAMVDGNEVLGTFICQGKVDPKLLAAMAKMPEAQQAHPMTEERRARIEEAKKHPDEADCLAAQKSFTEILAKLESRA
jgi:Flavodoxins